MARALKKRQLKGVAQFRKLLFGERKVRLPTVVMNRAAFVAAERGVKKLKLSTVEKLESWVCKSERGVVRVFGWQEGYASLDAIVWTGTCLWAAQKAAGGIKRLVDKEEYAIWVRENCVHSSHKERWLMYCHQALKLEAGKGTVFGLAPFKLLWPPTGAHSIAAVRNLV
eukprot:CAMPEP_0181328946 /NCGR_PEP_ID=MMETSP1101-20121128/23028_1 /TAXON_ID=46948 /ORGANISM="Rhodomonas abbreviata, Strain Caron Lab Isolate" /LENGTH=168 /DNA_ID=CAMNT_0023437951 /DNA_START=554 /DNA_END=1060 /DNA_ORIENTATION=-